MELAPAFDDYISALDKQQKAEMAAIEAKEKAEQAALKAQQEANDAIVKAMEETASEAEKLMKELEDAARSAYSALERSVEMEKQAAQARLDVAREAYDAETQRIDAMRSQLEAARSELQAGVDESTNALDKALAAEVSTINESATAQIANINAALDAEVSAITAARDARLDALDEEKSALQTMVSELTSLADRYRQVAEPDVTGSGKGLIEALAAAKAGNFELAKELQVGAVSSAGFGSQSDMAIAAAIQAGRMQQISDLAQIEADKAAARLSDVELQIEATKLSADMQIEAEKAIAAEQEAAVKAESDRQIKIMTDQYNAALGIDTTVLSFAEAMNGYQEATKALDELAYEDQMSKLDMLQASADDVYKLHEEAYNQEISRLDEILADGESRLNAMLGIDDSVKSVDESLIELGNAISASTAQRGETEALRQELAKLREDMAAANQSIAKSTATTAAVLQRIEIDGMDTRVIA